MARTKWPKALSESEFIEEALKRMDGRLPADFAGMSDAAKTKVMRAALTAFKEELVDCVTQGYKVNLTGVASFEPVVKLGRPKGTVVTNPFKPDAKPKTLNADEPDKFAVKIGKSSAFTAAFPSLKSADGKELYAKLPRPKRTKKKAAK